MASKDGEAVVGDGREETDAERADRNWNELLQEMRVMQTGTQILAAFLFTLPFQQRFTSLDDVQRTGYLVLVALAAAVTALILTPISLHRFLFRHGLKKRLVDNSTWFVRAGLAGVALLVAGTAALVFDIVLGRTAGTVVLVALLALVFSLWFAYPKLVERRGREER
ncbi:sodium:proton antiporter [Paenarthrobacter sp. DKR-5]|uniref:DUF6328 family protein n=1 Tax=Paenarthrobacter sp. DKR-5 TaxID=2835535 RepID=UPI001BDDB65A|nr:DUF6328 family protein [Paenarthrobacter sp. DKR-5]MBT1001527.1 sodium:proton antiporter [Paenarthrobacter sp. DKR-5]